mgnify:CR=1 FL=1
MPAEISSRRSFGSLRTGRAVALAAGAGLLSALVCVSCRSPAPTTKQHIRVTTRTLLHLPDTARRATLAIGSDGYTFAYVERTTAGQRIVHSGGIDREYEEVSNPVLLRETQRRLYWAIDRELGENDLLIIDDGRPIRTGLGRPNPFVISRNGTRWATAGNLSRDLPGRITTGKAAVYSNGELLGVYEDVSVPAISSDGRHVAFVGERADGSHVLVVDGKEERVFERPPADKASPPVRMSDRAPGLGQFKLSYLSDGSLVVLAYDADGWALYRNGTRLASFAHVLSLGGQVAVSFDPFRTAPTILANSLSSADNAPVLSWWEKVPGEEAKWRVVRDGQAEPFVCSHYWEFMPPMLSDDGRHVAYPCYRDLPVAPEVLADFVTDSTRWGPFYSVWGVAFSPAGDRVAYAASLEPRGKWWYFIGGQAFPTAYEEAWRPRFTLDGKHLAWEGRWRGKVVAVIDGDSLYSFEAVLWGPEFPRPNTVAWVVRRGEKVKRVEALLPPEERQGR